MINAPDSISPINPIYAFSQNFQVIKLFYQIIEYAEIFLYPYNASINDKNTIFFKILSISACSQNLSNKILKN